MLYFGDVGWSWEGIEPSVFGLRSSGPLLLMTLSYKTSDVNNSISNQKKIRASLADAASRCLSGALGFLVATMVATPSV